MTCKGCGQPLDLGAFIQYEADGEWHEACASDRAAGRQPGATRERLTQLRARVQLDGLDAGTLRTVLLALLDEAIR